METKKVLVINGHPDKISFNEEIAQAYLKELADLGTEATYLPLRDLKFDPVLRNGYRLISELEPDLKNAVELIKKSTHIVWIHPLWWFGMPALLKGFIDRVFLPDIAFSFNKETGEEKPLLGGRSARIISTGDAGKDLYEKVFNNSAITQLKLGILEFSGFDPVSVNYIAPIYLKTREELDVYLDEIRAAAKEDFKLIS
ncbi:hypothetical protein IQ37_07725 [Chryseobacterium piperi]|uniref:Flavodoxin-like fold domain-containing protein n=1 Tax=Chryseobacterium piperi TaxID=558152 RepID=A0A086BJA8_9FLAO|nr:NAD(P)H-dependent oxidoreductase [Chryseobacterium piperi]ASW76423.1 flavodoxin family protein [Chryseobacterium piperi]KFF29022.1 hypothetical protein IQ37_07725 [Chryseobacterium piperi]